MLEYSIEGCPIKWHDLNEIIEFFLSLSVKSLYLFSMSRILLNGIPLFWLIVYDKDGLTFMTYKEFPRR